MDKSPDAFRTISEVAEALETPAHVLRFWESRFPQIRPVKRAGGRRYYRPADVALLTGIKRLLHDEGMTIRGVQKVLREQGIRHVAALAGVTAAEMAAFDEGEAIEAALAAQFSGPIAVDAEVELQQAVAAQVVALETALSSRPPRSVSAASDTVTPFPPRESPPDAFAPLWSLPPEPEPVKPAEPAEIVEIVAEAPMHLDAEEEADPVIQGILALRDPAWGIQADLPLEPVPTRAAEAGPLPETTLARRLRSLRRPLKPNTSPGFALQRDRLALLLERVSGPQAFPR